MKEKKIFALALMLLIAPMTYGYNASNENMLETARKNYAAGRIQPAIDAYWRVLERAPEKLIAHLELGDIYRRIKMYDRAVELLEPALANASLSNMDNEVLCKYYCSLTAAFIGLKNEGKANQYLIKAAQASPKNPRPRVLLGDIYKSNGKYSNAEKAYKQALKLDPNYKPASDKLAVLIRDYGNKLKSYEPQEKTIAASREIILMPTERKQLKPKKKKKKKPVEVVPKIDIIETNHKENNDSSSAAEPVFAYPSDEVPIDSENTGNTESEYDSSEQIAEQTEKTSEEANSESDQYYIDMLVGGEMTDKEKASAYFVHEGTKGLQKIEDLMYNADPDVRIIAVRTMARFTDCKKQVKAILLDSIDDSNQEVVAEIKAVLSTLEDIELDN